MIYKTIVDHISTTFRINSTQKKDAQSNTQRMDRIGLGLFLSLLIWVEKNKKQAQVELPLLPIIFLWSKKTPHIGGVFFNISIQW